MQPLMGILGIDGDSIVLSPQRFYVRQRTLIWLILSWNWSDLCCCMPYSRSFCQNEDVKHGNPSLAGPFVNNFCKEE